MYKDLKRTCTAIGLLIKYYVLVAVVVVVCLSSPNNNQTSQEPMDVAVSLSSPYNNQTSPTGPLTPNLRAKVQSSCANALCDRHPDHYGVFDWL